MDAILAAELTTLLCQQDKMLRQLFINEGANIMTTLVGVVRDLHSQVSEECLSSCLLAIAALTRQNSTSTTMMVHSYNNDESALTVITRHYLRYPNRNIRAASASIVAHCAALEGEAQLSCITG